MASRDSDISTNVTGRVSVPGMDFSSMTLEEEANAAGWTRITKPVGAEPIPTFTAGMRGEPDADADNTLTPGAASSKVYGEEG